MSPPETIDPDSSASANCARTVNQILGPPLEMASWKLQSLYAAQVALAAQITELQEDLDGSRDSNTATRMASTIASEQSSRRKLDLAAKKLSETKRIIAVVEERVARLSGTVNLP